MGRKLSYVEIVKDVNPVENSDNLDVVSIRGWKVVTKRGEFNVGDLCVYFEIDSVLPQVELFEFLKPRGYRIKTIKLRGQISQGLVVPIESVSQQFSIPLDQLQEVGYCLDERIDIKHADELGDNDPRSPKNYFPSYIRKTDQERCQNLNIGDIVGREYEVSVKLDGSSMTVFYNQGMVGVCSRNCLLPEDDTSHFTTTANKLGVKEILSQYCSVHNRNLALQGELIGEGIQGNKEKIKGHDWYIFDIWDIDSQTYLSYQERHLLITQLGLESVPLLFDEPLFLDPSFTIPSILSMADGESLHSNVREGIVFKTLDGSFSFKAISNKFLLKF